MTPFAPPGLTLEHGSVRAAATVQRFAMLQRKKGTFIEEDTTDAGSSDADSSCSSGSEGSMQSGRSFNDWAAASRLRRLAPRKLTMGKKSRFSSTPLATIPGTPNAEQHMELSAVSIEQPERNKSTPENDILATAPPSVHGGHCSSTGKSRHNATGVVSKHATEMVLARAKRQSLPLKLQLPAHLERARRQLDPSMPAKKRPAYMEFSTITVADMQTLDPTMPLKKTVSKFLLEDSQPTETYLAPR